LSQWIPDKTKRTTISNKARRSKVFSTRRSKIIHATNWTEKEMIASGLGAILCMKEKASPVLSKKSIHISLPRTKKNTAAATKLSLLLSLGKFLATIKTGMVIVLAT
jgi:hypothetical protein